MLGGIVADASAPARSRIEAIRELRQVAAVGPNANTPTEDRERFTIKINFGTNKVHKEIDLKPTKREDELTIEAECNEDDEHEYERSV